MCLTLQSVTAGLGLVLSVETWDTIAYGDLRNLQAANIRPTEVPQSALVGFWTALGNAAGTGQLALGALPIINIPHRGTNVNCTSEAHDL